MADTDGAVRWGILGAANIALTRTIPALRKAINATPAALASSSRERGEAAAAQLGIPKVYTDYDALLADPEIEAVYVPTANNEHFRWCLRALEAGKAVLCEKPLTLSSAEVQQLIVVRDRLGGRIEEAFSYRNHPQWTDLAALFRSGEIGTPRAVHAALAKPFLDPTDIRNDPALGGGALYDLGSYAISAVSQALGRPPLRVCASMQFDDRGVDGLTSALLDYGDAQATFSVSIRSGPSAWATHQQFTVIGDNGWATMDFPFAHARPTPCTLSVGDGASVGSRPSRTINYAPVDQYQLQVERFSALVRGEAAPAWPIEDAALTLRVIEAVRAAAAEARTISL
jgi:predicted dehydrogenase